jgi:hypothetical protein
MNFKRVDTTFDAISIAPRTDVNPPVADVFFGRSDGFMKDFHWDAANQKLRVRSVIIGDLGYSPDLGIRRAGPDGADPYTATASALPSGTKVGAIYWQPYGTNNNFDAVGGTGRIAEISALTRGIPTGTSRPGSLHLQTTGNNQIEPADRLVIRENGRVGIGTTNPINLLHVAGAISAQVANSTTTDGSLCYANNDTVTFEIRKCASSQKYKTAIRDLGVDWNGFMKLRPREFTWRETGQRDLGFVAEEMEAINPLLAVHNPDGSAEGIKYFQIMAILTGLVQDQQRAIERLQAELAALKEHSGRR